MNEEQKPVENIHSPSNFHPEDYEVVAYLDNRPPQFCPFAGANMQEAAARYEQERKFWQDEIKHYFPQGQNIHKCGHCGNGNVRYIVACLHKPSGQNVVFGDICVDRLSFPNRSEFKAAQVRARAEAGHARLRIYAARQKFLSENPEIVAAIEDLSNPANEAVHKRNDFARDILAKLNQYGEMSPRQAECFISSIKRDHEYAAKKAAEAQEVKGEFPRGRVEFNCEVLSTRVQESQFGEQIKMLVKMEDNNKVWLTVPAACAGSAERGAKLRLKATLEVSKDDPHFGFGKRPNLIANLSEMAPVGPRNNVGEGA